MSAFAVIIGGFSLFVLPVYAAKGYEGYPVYRDGVLLVEWHAAIMEKPSIDYTNPVIHIGGLNCLVKNDSWSNFLDGSSFKGVYTPKGNVTDKDRDNVLATARKLATEKIPYTVLCQVDYSIFCYGSTIQPKNISSMRCDGVVEYCYELNNIRISGDDVWNVTQGGLLSWTRHSGIFISPKQQASLMTKISDVPPTGIY